MKEPGILKGGGDKPPLRPVWVATHGVELEVEVELELDLKWVPVAPQQYTIYPLCSLSTQETPL